MTSVLGFLREKVPRSYCDNVTFLVNRDWVEISFCDSNSSDGVKHIVRLEFLVEAARAVAEHVCAEPRAAMMNEFNLSFDPGSPTAHQGEVASVFARMLRTRSSVVMLSLSFSSPPKEGVDFNALISAAQTNRLLIRTSGPNPVSSSVVDAIRRGLAAQRDLKILWLFVNTKTAADSRVLADATHPRSFFVELNSMWGDPQTLWRGKPEFVRDLELVSFQTKDHPNALVSIIGIISMAECLLEHGSKLIDLDLIHAILCDASIAALTRLFTHHPTLTGICINPALVRSSMDEPLLELVRTAATRVPNLETFQVISDARTYIVRELSQCSTLRLVTLNDMRPDACPYLLQLIRRNANLERMVMLSFTWRRSAMRVIYDAFRMCWSSAHITVRPSISNEADVRDLCGAVKEMRTARANVLCLVGLPMEDGDHAVLARVYRCLLPRM